MLLLGVLPALMAVAVFCMQGEPAAGAQEDAEERGQAEAAAEEHGEADDMTCAICLERTQLVELALVKGCEHQYCGAYPGAAAAAAAACCAQRPGLACMAACVAESRRVSHGLTPPLVLLLLLLPTTQQ